MSDVKQKKLGHGEIRETPWQVSYSSAHGLVIGAPDGRLVVRVGSGSHPCDIGNAHIMSAAPELFKELENIVAKYDLEEEDKLSSEKALVKARGEHAPLFLRPKEYRNE